MGLKRIVFNEPERTIKLTLRGMQLDPGTLAAGFALDRAARAMRGAGAQAGVLELSGNTLLFHKTESTHGVLAKGRGQRDFVGPSLT